MRRGFKTIDAAIILRRRGYIMNRARKKFLPGLRKAVGAELEPPAPLDSEPKWRGVANLPVDAAQFAKQDNDIFETLMDENAEAAEVGLWRVFETAMANVLG